MRGQGKWAIPLTAALLLSGCAAPREELPAATAPIPTQQAVEETRAPGVVLACREENGFHPLTCQDRLNLTLAPLLYQSLFRLDAHFNAVEQLCAGYEVSEDGLRWSFRLAPALFSDGTEMEVTDVVKSLNAARKSLRYAARMADVTEVTAEGGAVRVTLSRPNAALPALLDIPVFRESGDPLRPLGTGEYVLQGEEGALRLVSRTGSRGEWNEIPLRQVAGADELIQAFDAGEVTLVDMDMTGTGALGYSARLGTREYPTSTMIYLGCNTGSGVAASQTVRQALGLALNRKAMSGVFDGHVTATPLALHPVAGGYDAGLARMWSYQPDRAVQLLEEAGWSKDGEGRMSRRGAQLALRLIVNQDNPYKVKAAEAAAGDLEALGCQVTVAALPWEDFVEALDHGRFDLYLAETALTPDFDLSPLLAPGGAVNYTGFSDAGVNELLDKCRAPGEETRESTLVNLCGAVAERAPVLPLCFKNGSVVTQWGQLEQLAPTPDNVFAGPAD